MSRVVCSSQLLRLLAIASLFALLLGFTASSRAVAQAKPTGGTFVSLELQITRLNRGLGVVLGIAGGWRSVDSFSIGAALYDLLNGTPLPDQDGVAEPLRTKLHFWGVLLGKDFLIDRTGLGGQLLLGVGDVSAYTTHKNDDRGRSWYFVAVPAFVVRLPTPGLLDSQIALHYRLAQGFSYGGTATSSLSGPALGFALGARDL